MTEYALYIESGPRRKHTMVHILGLLGCIAQGPTTEDALAATPDAIRDFLAFLKGHGTTGDPNAPLTTVVKEHVMKGSFIGQGNPPDGFAPDFEAFGARESKVLVDRLRWLRADFTTLVLRTGRDEFVEKPTRARALASIVAHVSDASGTYLRYAVGQVDGLTEALRAVRDHPGDAAALEHRWAIDSNRWAALTPSEREQRVTHGQQTWTARRGLRRALEHEWEHFTEMRDRLA